MLQVVRLLEEDEGDLATAVVHILASAGRQMANADGQTLQVLIPRLEGMCQAGSPNTSKLALRSASQEPPLAYLRSVQANSTACKRPAWATLDWCLSFSLAAKGRKRQAAWMTCQLSSDPRLKS